MGSLASNCFALISHCLPVVRVGLALCGSLAGFGVSSRGCRVFEHTNSLMSVQGALALPEPGRQIDVLAYMLPEVQSVCESVLCVALLLLQLQRHDRSCSFDLVLFHPRSASDMTQSCCCACLSCANVCFFWGGDLTSVYFHR